MVPAPASARPVCAPSAYNLLSSAVSAVQAPLLPYPGTPGGCLSPCKRGTEFRPAPDLSRPHFSPLLVVLLCAVDGAQTAPAFQKPGGLPVSHFPAPRGFRYVCPLLSRLPKHALPSLSEQALSLPCVRSVFPSAARSAVRFR